jgi:hypothetical protein
VPVYWRATPADRVPFSGEPGLVQRQHRVRVAQALDHVGPDVVTHAVGVPPGAVEQPLHPVGQQLPGLFGQPPAVLAFDLAQQPLQVAKRPRGSMRPNRGPIRSCSSTSPSAHTPACFSACLTVALERTERCAVRAMSPPAPWTESGQTTATELRL